MTLHKLLRRLSAVAHTMLEGTGRADFEVDKRFLQKTGANIPFLWIVRKHGTGLYRLDEDNDRAKASFMLGHYVGSHTDFLIFHYDGKCFRQLFLSDALAELDRLFKLQRIQNNMHSATQEQTLPPGRQRLPSSQDIQKAYPHPPHPTR